MKKTLLMIAAALAAGVISSQAQVYSQNVVGYINITVPSHGYFFFANQLVNGSDSGATNNNVQAVLKSGFVSDPNGVNNTILYFWNGSGYNVYYYYTDIDAQNQFDPTYGDGWYDGAGNFGSYNPAQWPKVGQGFFIHHTGSTKLWTNSFVIQ